MPSLSNIPEPTTAYRPEADPPDAPVLPMPIAPSMAYAHDDQDGARLPADNDIPQQQIDGVSGLLLLLVAGALLRGVLGLFGPMQGSDADQFQLIADRGRDALSGSPTNAYPVFDLFALGVDSAGAANWLLVAIGSLLTFIAIPAAYIVGHVITGRRIAGILAASLVAVHPGVLAAANTMSGVAAAMGLLTIGLALICHSPKRGPGYVLGGGVMLGLAGLAAPLCWLPGVMAGPLVYRLSRKQGRRVAWGRALLVFVIAIGPVIGYRLTFFGNSAQALVAEFAQSDSAIDPLPVIDHMLITMTDPSLPELGEALHLPLGNAGHLTIAQEGGPVADERRDIVADVLADAWLLMNAGLAGLAAVSVGVMLVRRRIVEAMALAVPLIAVGFCVLPPSEALRLPMIALVGVLAAGLFATRPTPAVTAEEREAKRAAKLAAKEEKQRACEDRNLAKHKDSLYAFDKPSRRERKQHKQRQAKPIELPTAVLTEQPSSDAPLPGRPI